ncbi:MAG: rhomboid family intramembrane serine protease [Chloroflexi bacterium]|nr:rhomboid family intramembrane serine protease [Chloroflexota bacterium]
MIPIQDTVRSRTFPLVTWSLIALNVVVFFYEASLPPALQERFITTWGFVPARLFGGQVLWGLVTLFTSMFLHGGWFHLISNMWALYIFGDNVEDRMGPGRYLLFYILSGLAAALLQGALTPWSRVPMVGASGAISGVLGAYFLFYPQARVITWVPVFLFFGYYIDIPAVLYLGLWFFSQFYSGLFSLALPQGMQGGGVAWWAHIGGFLFGLLFARAFAPADRAPRWYPDEFWPW